MSLYAMACRASIPFQRALPHAFRALSTTTAPTTRGGAGLSASLSPEGLVVSFPGLGSRAIFHGMWLLDHCPSTRHALTGQRMIDLHGIPLNVQPASVRCAAGGEGGGGGSVHLTWPGMQHTSTFSAAWLRQHAYWWETPAAAPGKGAGVGHPPRGAPASSEGALAVWWEDAARDASQRVVWTAATLQGGNSEGSGGRGEGLLPRVPHGAFMGGTEGLARALVLLRDYGFVLVDGCPGTEAATEAACLRIGFLRPTLYGAGMWRTELRPAQGVTDTAYTELPLALHTDGNYLECPPGLQAFHCTVPDASGGGDSLLLDGLALARRLQAKDPAAFALLCVWPLPYHHTGSDGLLSASRPVFALDASGNVEAVHFNNSDRGPVTLQPSWGRELALARALCGSAGAAPGGAALAVQATLASPATAIPALYSALRALHECLESPELLFRIPLRQGMLLIFNNQRVLHGRLGFEVASGRTLVGCYQGRDEWESRLRELLAKQ